MAGSSIHRWKLIEVRAHEGFAFGLHYPSLVNVVAVPAMALEARNAVLARIVQPLASLEGLSPVAFPGNPPEEDVRLATVRWFLQLADYFNDLARFPIAERAKCLFLTADAVGCVVPCLAGSLGTMHALLDHVRELANEPLVRRDDELRRDLRWHMNANPHTSNGPRLFRAAVESGIVVQQLPGNAVQYGLGKNSVRMDGTFTQYTSILGTRIARRKSVASDFLRRGGLPVASHRLAADADAAVKLADELGYPVVVKPNDLDGGAAVRADLRGPAEVREAFRLAREVSGEVVVQKHCDGRDYRLMVFRGELIWAVERQPAGVTGDGTTSIVQLVAATNAEPGRGEGPHARLKRIKLDDEAIGLLARDGRTIESIPGHGEFVRLRRSANISSGGKPVQVMDVIHASNAELAIRAAEVIDLDLAGIDLIMPDISKPWDDSDTIICEVNAGPEIGGNTTLHLYPMLLESLLEGDGNIPVVAFYGGSRSRQLAESIAADLLTQGFTPGGHTPDGVFVGSDWLKRGKMSCLAGGRILASHRSVEALLLAGIDESVLGTGLPVPRIDLLAVPLAGLVDPMDRSADSNRRAGAVLSFLEPCSDRIVLVTGEEAEGVSAANIERFQGKYPVVTESELAVEISGKLQAMKFRRNFEGLGQVGSRMPDHARFSSIKRKGSK